MMRKTIEDIEMLWQFSISLAKTDGQFLRKKMLQQKQILLKTFSIPPKKNLNETDDGKEFVHKTFTNLSNNTTFIKQSRKTLITVVFAKRCSQTVRDLLEKPDFLKEDGKLPTMIKQCKIKKRSATNLKPIKASPKKNEGFF